MRTAFALTVAALAGSAIASPYKGQYKEVDYVNVVVETVVHTVYWTEGYPVATPTPKPVYQAPAVTTVVYQAPKPTKSAYVEPSYEAAPAPSSTEVAAPAPTDDGYQAIVDTWRSKLGLKALANSAKLQANALDTVVSSNGQMVHKLNPGTMGQVLAPGSESDFEHVFVGGWLCEIPSLPGLDGVCATQSEGWTYEGQTGHAEILTSGSYSEIGCALSAGIWCCDLA